MNCCVWRSCPILRIQDYSVIQGLNYSAILPIKLGFELESNLDCIDSSIKARGVSLIFSESWFRLRYTPTIVVTQKSNSKSWTKETHWLPPRPVHFYFCFDRLVFKFLIRVRLQQWRYIASSQLWIYKPIPLKSMISSVESIDNIFDYEHEWYILHNKTLKKLLE